MMIHKKRDTCRSCRGTRFELVLSLGEMPLANSFLKTPEDFNNEKFYPLDLYLCENCSLLQLLDVIHPEILFRDYIYVTGTSETMAAHNIEYADSVIRFGNLQPDSLAVEIASNDGSLLSCFRSHGIRTLGIEPARNISRIAREKGIETVNEFFDSSCARKILEFYGPARVVIGNNVLAHVDDTQDFLKGCHDLLSNDGFLVIEVPYLRELLRNLEYDTIYHEHLCYFSVTALMRLFETVNLGIARIEFVPVHGGSIRVFAIRSGKHSNSVVDLAKEERELGFTQFQRYRSFARAVEQNRKELQEMLQQFRSEHKRVAAYGAPAKGNTLLNYCNIGTDLVSYTVDKSPLKVGLFTPGKHLPVRSIDILARDQPDYVLLLAWNYAKEVLLSQQEYRNKGGRFILPIPQPEVIE
jgi:hypothetical protein